MRTVRVAKRRLVTNPKKKGKVRSTSTHSRKTQSSGETLFRRMATKPGRSKTEIWNIE